MISNLNPRPHQPLRPWSFGQDASCEVFVVHGTPGSAMVPPPVSIHLDSAADWLPPGAVLARWTNQPESPWAGEVLLPEEEAHMRGASPARRREYGQGRVCARAALAELGVTPGPIGVGALREPLWPSGAVGSITHCRGLCAAAVARTRDFRAIGIDAELLEPLPPGVASLVLDEGEGSALEGEVGLAFGPARTALPWDCVTFSAKESVIKALSPILHRPIDFLETRVRFEAGGRFRVLPGRPRSLDEDLLAALAGRFVVTAAHVLTSAALRGELLSLPIQ